MGSFSVYCSEKLSESLRFVERKPIFNDKCMTPTISGILFFDPPILHEKYLWPPVFYDPPPLSVENDSPLSKFDVTSIDIECDCLKLHDPPYPY